MTNLILGIVLVLPFILAIIFDRGFREAVGILLLAISPIAAITGLFFIISYFI